MNENIKLTDRKAAYMIKEIIINDKNHTNQYKEELLFYIRFWYNWARYKGQTNELEALPEDFYKLNNQIKTMKLSDVKDKIDEWFDSKTPEEVYEILKNAGVIEEENEEQKSEVPKDR